MDRIKDQKEPIAWNDFEKLDIRIGTIHTAKVFEEAKKPAYILQIDFGQLGLKKSSAQITDYYQPEDLPGKQVMAVVNFPPKQIGPIMSECLVMGVVDSDGKVTLLSPDQKVENGLSIS